jgi:hypothetical protein
MTARSKWILISIVLVSIVVLVGRRLYLEMLLPPENGPKKIAHLAIYDVSVQWRRDLRTPPKDGALVHSVPDDVTSRMFCETLPSSGWVLWKGGRLAVAQMTDGSRRTLALSNYGGVFRIDGDAGYYRVTGNSLRVFEDTVAMAHKRFYVIRRLHLHLHIR